MDLIVATGLVILLKLDSNRQFFSWCDLEIWWMTSTNYRAPLLHYIKFCASSQTPQWIQTGVIVQKRSIRVKIGDFFVPCDIEIWWMTLKNNRAPLLCYIKLCASFQSHRWIQTGVTVWKRLIQVKIANSLSCVTLKFNGWPWKTIRHLFYVASSFAHHFIAISELEQLERLCSEDTPRRLMITHTIGSQVKKIIDLELKMLQSGHDFQSQGRMT